MDGFLGTRAPFRADLTLVVIVILVIVAAFGYIRARRKRFSTHCPVMATAALLNWVPVLLIMVPTWLDVASGTRTLATGPFASAPIFHGVLGAGTQLVMTYTVARMYWLKQLPPAKPLWLMRATAILWVLTAIGGTAVYVVSYVL